MMRQGKNVVITGANRGIGKAVVESFCKNGDNVWACCRKRNDNFEQWLSECADKYSVQTWPVYFDLSRTDDIKNGFKEICHNHLPIDVLVNNAGIGHLGLFQMTPQNIIREIYEINLFAPMELCQLAVRVMSRRKHGHIINIASTAAEEVYIGNSIYGASKAAMVAFTKSLAAEVAPLGIQVNAIAPGLTDTDMSSVFEGEYPEIPLERSAIGRKLDPKEIADVVVALTAEQLHIINGQMICVNGGSK